MVEKFEEPGTLYLSSSKCAIIKMLAVKNLSAQPLDDESHTTLNVSDTIIISLI